MFWRKKFQKQSAELDELSYALKMYISPFSEGNIIHLFHWLIKFMVAFGRLNIDEGTACILLPRFLHGTAKLRWSNISNRSKKHWRKTIKSLSESFRSEIDWLLAGDELCNISQGTSTISEYSLRIEFIGCIAYEHFHKSCRERLLVSHFLRNCNRPLKSKLLALCPIPLTLEEIVNKAEEIQKRLICQHEENGTIEIVQEISKLSSKCYQNIARVKKPLLAAIGDATEEFEKNGPSFFQQCK